MLEGVGLPGNASSLIGSGTGELLCHWLICSRVLMRSSLLIGSRTMDSARLCFYAANAGREGGKGEEFGREMEHVLI